MSPTERAWAASTAARKARDGFEPVQRHVLQIGDGDPQVMVTELTPVQRQIVELFGLSPDSYGR